MHEQICKSLRCHKMDYLQKHSTKLGNSQTKLQFKCVDQKSMKALSAPQATSVWENSSSPRTGVNIRLIKEVLKVTPGLAL